MKRVEAEFRDMGHDQTKRKKGLQEELKTRDCKIFGRT